MKTSIIYTKRDKKTVLEESNLNEQKVYLKHIYENEVLKKTEVWNRNKVDSITLYPSEGEKTSDEEILFENIFLRSVQIIRIKNVDEYQWVHDKKYTNLLLTKEEMYINDFNSRKIASYKADQLNGVQLTKYLYLKDGDYREIDYSRSRNPYLEKEKFISYLNQVLTDNKSCLNSAYYLKFSPFFPSGEDPEFETVRYVSFYENKEITLQQAFFEREFDKNIYTEHQLRRTDHFKRLEIIKRTYFINNNSLFVPDENLSIPVEIHNLVEEKNGFKKWEIKIFKDNTLHTQEILVTNAEGERVFYQEIDPFSKKVLVTYKFADFSTLGGSSLTHLEYNSEGTLITEGVTLYDYWDSEFYSKEDMHQDGFFDSEYGKYFLFAYPEIPEGMPINKTVYKNHLDEIIPENEAKEQYEYSEETYQNGNLLKRISYKAHSYKNLKNDDYHIKKAAYYDDLENVPDLENFEDNSDEIYYNKRTANNYILYDFITRNYWDGKKAEFSGTVVYDNFYRVVSKIIYNAQSKELISGIKKFYMNVTPLLGQKYITVNFNSTGEVESYIDNRFTFPEYYTKENFENKNEEKRPVSQEYYKDIKSIVPNNPAFPFADFKNHTIFYAIESGQESEITGLMVDSKIKIAAEEYIAIHFLDSKTVLEDYMKMIPTSDLYFYHIENTGNTIETDFFGMDIHAHFSIDLNSRTIACQIIKSVEKNITFRKEYSNEATNVYFFYVGEQKIFVTFYSELLIDLLLKA
ncbi:hypothetical protein [Chryseobacterium sp. Mn2064]|uniref:hypothetical protein n=1 Tax=Chryseobacterium sp. Mn2064 TaxID=3395263 RepID=UPI003BEE82AF